MAGHLRIGLDAHMVGHRETGNETYVLGLLDGLSRLDRDFELYVYYTSDNAVDGASHVRARHLLGNSPWIRLAFDLPLQTWRDDLDVLHMTYTAPLWTRCPLVLTVHDISYVDHPEWFSARDVHMLSLTVPWSMRRADRVITVSEVCRAEIIHRYHLPENKVTCIHNAAGPAGQPIDQAEAVSIVRALGIDPAQRYVLAVGNLQPRKNLTRLINAYRNMLGVGIDANLVIVGPEHYRAQLVKAAAGDPTGRIKLTGYLTHRQLAACYACAAVFAFPSLYEGFGIPALEAMCHGVPVVCSRAGALPEVCGDAAYYFDPEDLDSITSALIKVLTDPDLRSVLTIAGKSRSSRFTWQRAAEQTAAVYEEVARETGLRQTTR